MIHELVSRWEEFCIPESFIGIGSTRKAYKVNDYVIKVHIHPIGYKQSIRELEIYAHMIERGYNHLFAQPYYVNSSISIQRFYCPLELENNQSYEIDPKKHAHFIPEAYHEIIQLLDSEFDSFDIKDSGNYGLNSNAKLTFIDYGMSKSVYEKEWVPQAEAGIIPQIDFDVCSNCGEEKELRMYGDQDMDKRCYHCGKE